MVRLIADLHIHSKYSRATSQSMDILSLSHFALVKGLSLLGTGDFTHPSWMKELEDSLVEIHATGLYVPKKDQKNSVYFMVTNEVCTIFDFEGKTRRIHHVILTQDLETAKQISDRLEIHGDLKIDGRPVLNMSAAELVEEVMGISNDNMVIPAHIWTPWFSLFGSFNGYDRIEDCYQDMTKHISALETGLSSDPPMNWRVSSLDHYTLVSNSDSHSPSPYRIGREANVFEVEDLTYSSIIEAIRSKDSDHIKFTIETYPQYGKYHWTGHRRCGVSMSAAEVRNMGNICPHCHRMLTRGVEERVEDLADRPKNFRPKGAIDYIHLLPLHEIISTVLGIGSLSTKTWSIYNSLVSRFGDEYTVLLDVSERQLSQVVDLKIAKAVARIRHDEVKILPGYDGEYGKLVIRDEEKKASQTNINEVSKNQANLEKFL